MHKKTLALLIPILISPQVLYAETPLKIEITEGQLADPAQQKTTIERLQKGIAADGGDLLRQIPGLSGTRMGGHGIDPIIRGQSHSRINIQLDGAVIQGACPNRMDPSTAYSPIETYDSITVIKGNHSVAHGAGGSGGTVLFERRTERMDDQTPLRGQVGAAYKSNSKTKDVFADITAGNSQGFVRAIAQRTQADNYEDGDGNETRTGFKQQAGNLMLGYTPSYDRRIELSIEATDEKDMLYAGAGMDAPESNNDTIRLRFEEHNAGPFSLVKGELYRSEVEHIMDNYSYRPTPMMYMATPSTSDTQGGRISLKLPSSANLEWTLGVDRQDNNRDAIRYSGMMPGMMMTQSYVWPDVTIEQSGFFAEAVQKLAAEDKFKAGLRFDRVSSDAAKAGLSPMAMMTMSANGLYNMYYGQSAKTKDDNNVSGFIRYEHGLFDGKGMLFSSISRSVRSADATEAYIAANNSNAMMRWVGNPNLETEQHHQFELGLSWINHGWETSSAVFYNDVNDYILRDRAHGQDGILMSDNATIYRNIDATLYGVETAITRHLSPGLSTQFTLAYVRAENDTDGRAIAQTPPLEGSISADYQHGDWDMGAILNWASKQTRVDDSAMTGSGLDAGKTAGYGVLDLYSAYRVTSATTVKLGMDNVFDRSYAYHVNRADVDPFNPNAIQVKEPGRELWVKVRTEF